MLTVAVPNKGSLAEAAAGLLAEAGYRQRRDSKDLATIDGENDVEFFYLRPRDIAIYVGEGTLDVGITGRDLLLDSGAHAEEALQLGFGASTFRFAAPEGTVTAVEQLAGQRIATSYPGLVDHWLAERGIEAHVVRLDGAVETSVRLGVADAIADVVQTGTTLKQAGLAVFGDPILSSEAVLITRQGSAPSGNGYEVLKRRLESVLVARSYVMMDYDIPAEAVDAAVEITPGIESPTISPLRREGWVAVRSMVPRASAQSVMDRLYDLGARGILVTDILACRV
jgi:ATP phosphoribosyltransferase